MVLISKQIDEYLKDKPIPFHSPAHCGTVNPRDLSELTGLDDLQYPSEIIAESQNFVAELFGAEQSFYLINGASVGIHAALMSIKSFCEVEQNKVVQKIKPVLAACNVHKSVVAGLIFAGLDVEWFEPEWLGEWDVYGRFNLELFASNEQITEFVNSKFSALVVSNPTYEGFYSKLPELEIPIIVDEAHGAHYHFSDKLPKPALECGADIVVQSWHKCLGTLTQAGVLHISKSSKIPAQIVQDNLRLLQSTSPSYLLLESLCSTAHKMAEQGEEIFDRVIGLSSEIKFERAHNSDPLRVLFNVNFLDPTSKKLRCLPGQICDSLFEENGIALESYTSKAALAFINYTHSKEDINKLNKVHSFFQEQVIDFNLLDEINEPNVFKPKFEKQVLSPREAFYSACESVPLEQAIGRISRELYAPCPPGIPLLVPGQIITKQNVKILQYRNSYLDGQNQKNTIQVCFDNR